MKSFIGGKSCPTDWSSEGHLHLSIQNLFLENNLSVIIT